MSSKIENLKENKKECLNWTHVLCKFEQGSQALRSANVSKSDITKVNQKNEIYKNNLENIIEKISDSSISDSNFIYSIAKSIESPFPSSSLSNYKTITTPNSSFKLRVANHYATSSNFTEKTNNQTINYGIVLKIKIEKKHHKSKEVSVKKYSFSPSDTTNYLEFVYFPDKTDDNRKIAIVNGLKNLIETGSIMNMPEPDRLHASGIFKKVLDKLKKEGYDTLGSLGKHGSLLKREKDWELALKSIWGAERWERLIKIWDSDHKKYGFVEDKSATNYIFSKRTWHHPKVIARLSEVITTIYGKTIDKLHKSTERLHRINLKKTTK